MNQSAESSVSGRPLTRGELAELEQLQAELARLTTQHDALVFVLGSYHPMKKHRLRNVQSEIESQSRSDIEARLMTEIIPGSDDVAPGHKKFRMIARYADAIVGVVEDDRGGFTYEQGVICDNQPYFQKTFVMKKSYASFIEDQKYSWMQGTTLFTELEYADRIYEWKGKQKFAMMRDELIGDVQRHLR